MVYDKKHTRLITSSNEMDMVDLRLMTASGNIVTQSVSDRNNVRIIEHEFVSNGYYYFSANPRQLIKNDGENNYAGVDVHISFMVYGLSAEVPDLTYNGAFNYNTIELFDNEAKYRNKAITVEVKKRTGSGTTAPSDEIVAIKNSGIGRATSISNLVRNFISDERIEISLYADPLKLIPISRQYIKPEVITFI